MKSVTESARELSQEEAQQRAEVCFQLDQAIKAGLRAGREAMWATAKAAHEFDEQSGWTALGYDTVSEWLADPEVGMTYRTFFRLVSTYRELVVIRQVPDATLRQLDASKVDIVMPAVKAGRTNLTDALEDVKELGARDLRSKYIAKPDPRDAVPDRPDDNAQAIQQAQADANVGTDEPSPEPVNEGPPVFADEVEVPEEVAQNTSNGDSGPLPDIVVEPVDEVQRPGVLVSPKLCRGIKALAQEGRDALARPDRLAPDRRARKEALENLILGLEAAGLA